VLLEKRVLEGLRGERNSMGGRARSKEERQEGSRGDGGGGTGNGGLVAGSQGGKRARKRQEGKDKRKSGSSGRHLKGGKMRPVTTTQEEIPPQPPPPQAKKNLTPQRPKNHPQKKTPQTPHRLKKGGERGQVLWNSKRARRHPAPATRKKKNVLEKKKTKKWSELPPETLTFNREGNTWVQNIVL